IMISIIIPAYNEEKYLEKTFKSIKSQTYNNYEIIVVANGCTDNTISIAQKHADRLFSLNFPNVSIARNIGAVNAHGDTLIFLDADTRLAPNALEEINNQFHHAAVATIPAYPNAPKFHFYIINTAKNIMHRLKLSKGSSGVIITSNDNFKKTNGFDAHYAIRENSRFIQKLSKMGDYAFITNTYAITSARRYEKWGLIGATVFWLINRWNPENVKYEAVR
ncbi:MAG TPA: glycosyltransferase, partial [Candidatus Nanoarchaeia archaeon]|nr:glycosyltransferase [Candidatus Nanoarchaeia archaeon]